MLIQAELPAPPTDPGAAMADIPRLQDLSAAEIKAALASTGDDLTDEQVLAIREFVVRVGGVENARLAVDMLADLERAA
jgi:hypothetical protein